MISINLAFYIRNELTGNVQAGLSADDGTERVGRQTLIDADIFLFVQMAEAEVASCERIARPWSGHDERVIQLPPVKEEQDTAETGEQGRRMLEEVGQHEKILPCNKDVSR